MKRPPLPALTGLRFLAAAQVVLFHSVGTRLERMPPALGSVIGSGYTGVSLFFVLSGFVLAYNYLSPGGTGLAKPGEFLAARVARVYPVYLLGVLLALPGFALRMLRIGDPIEAGLAGAPVLLSAVTLTQSWVPSYACQINCPGWSLSVEALFYLAFPLLAAWLAPRVKGWLIGIVAASWALSLAMASAYLRLDPDGLGAVSPLSNGVWLNVLKYNPLVRLPEFVIGMSAGLLFLGSPASPGSRSAAAAWVGLAVIGAGLLAGSSLPYPLVNNGLLLGPFALLVVALAGGRGVPARVLSSRPLVRLGEASYALYILHVPFHSVLRRLVPDTGWLAPQSTTFLVTYLVGSVLLALVVLRWIEEPARVMVRATMTRWLARRRHRPLGGATENVPDPS